MNSEFSGPGNSYLAVAAVDAIETRKKWALDYLCRMGVTDVTEALRAAPFIIEYLEESK
jgi:hypothetical protein